ncbi:hypothetical protein OsI_06889 [Oryza sativa Indica Group]|uniref:Uncharacterized protein n=1 Tax=Oryza sativa subsp. indica TaxID=39946 RepID=B8AFZ6_ORYSI|nr:hypothetical protein OsI_06889 [Oryza sativa Indica Group]
MKRNGDIASLFRKHEAKAKKRADLIDEEAQIEEEEPPLVEPHPVPTPVVEATNEEQDAPPEYDADHLQYDPGLRSPIASYDVNEQDAVRRAYILKGPNQCYAHDFPVREIYGSKNKPKPPVVATRESKAAMSPAVLELAGYKVAAFVRYRRVGVSLALCYEAAALSLPPRSGSRPRWRPR